MAKSNIFAMQQDASGRSTFTLLPCVDGGKVILSQNTAVSISPPVGYNKWNVIFSYDPGLRVWVAIGTNVTAVLPTGTYATGIDELLPLSRVILAGQNISLITPDTAAQVGVRFDAIP